MARPRTFRHNVFLRLSQLEHAIVSYYGHEYGRDHTAIIRGMIKQYARADEKFDAKKFKRFVAEKMTPETENDQDLETELRDQVNDFAKSIR